MAGDSRPTSGGRGREQGQERERAAGAVAASASVLLDGAGDEVQALKQLSSAITQHALVKEVARAGGVSGALAVLRRAQAGRPASSELDLAVYNFAYDFASKVLECEELPGIEGVLESCVELSLALLLLQVQNNNMELARDAPALMRQVLRLARKLKDKGALATRVVAVLKVALRDDLVAVARLVKLAEDPMLVRALLDVLLKLGALKEGGRALLGKVLTEAGFKDRDLRDLDEFFDAGKDKDTGSAVVTRWVTRLEDEGGRSVELACDKVRVRLAAAAHEPVEATFVTTEHNPDLALDLSVAGAGLREGLDMFPLPLRWDLVEFEDGGPGAPARLVVTYPLKGSYLAEIADTHTEVSSLIARSIDTSRGPASEEDLDALKPQLAFVLSSDETVSARASSHINDSSVVRDTDLMRRLKAFFEAPGQPITLLYRAAAGESTGGTAGSDLGSGSPSASQAQRPVKISRAPGAIPVRGPPLVRAPAPVPALVSVLAPGPGPALASVALAPASASALKQSQALAPEPGPTAAALAETDAKLESTVVNKNHEGASVLLEGTQSPSGRKDRAPQLAQPSSPIGATESQDIFQEEQHKPALEIMTIKQLGEHARVARPDVFRAHFTLDEDFEPKKKGSWNKADLVVALAGPRDPARAAAADNLSQPIKRGTEHGDAEASDDEELRTGVIAFGDDGDGPSFKQPKSRQQVGLGKSAADKSRQPDKPSKSPAPDDHKAQAAKSAKSAKAKQELLKAADQADNLAKDRSTKAKSERKREGSASEGKRKAAKSDEEEPERKAAKSEEKRKTATFGDKEAARESPKTPHATTVSTLLKDSKVVAEAKSSPWSSSSSSAPKGKRKPALDFSQSSLESAAPLQADEEEEEMANTGAGLTAGSSVSRSTPTPTPAQDASLRSSAESLALRAQDAREAGAALKSVLDGVRQVAAALESLTTSTADAARKADAQGRTLSSLQGDLTAQRSQAAQVEVKAEKAAAEMAQHVASIGKSLGRLESGVSAAEKGLQHIGDAVRRKLDEALSPIQARLACATPGGEAAAQPVLVQHLAEVRQQQSESFERFDRLLQELLGTQRKAAEQVQRQSKVATQEMQTLLQKQQQQLLQLLQQQQQLRQQAHQEQGLQQPEQLQPAALIALPDVELSHEARALLAKVEALSPGAAAEMRPKAAQLARVSAGAQQALEAARADATASIARALKTFQRDAGHDADAKLRSVQNRKRQLTLETESTVDALQVKRARLGELHVQHMSEESAHQHALDALAAKVGELGESKRHEEKKASEQLAARLAAGQAALKHLQIASKGLVTDMHTKLENRRQSFEKMKKAIETATTA